ncbi:MAG: hypothetical protein EBZ32_14115, partial [Rhodobacteraceae bacterium]|nr:hypothetical protein [Paracoccaceae bacterium]
MRNLVFFVKYVNSTHVLIASIMSGLSESVDSLRMIQPTPGPSNLRFAFGKTVRGFVASALLAAHGRVL